MKTTSPWFSLPHLSLEYQYSREPSTFFISDWSSKGLDAVLVLKILNSVPEHLWYSPFHSQKEFVGRLVSVGMVESGSLFTASLIRIAEGIMGCCENPFFNLSGAPLDVLVEDQLQDDRLIVRVFVRLPKSSSDD